MNIMRLVVLTTGLIIVSGCSVKHTPVLIDETRNAMGVSRAESQDPRDVE